MAGPAAGWAGFVSCVDRSACHWNRQHTGRCLGLASTAFKNSLIPCALWVGCLARHLDCMLSLAGASSIFWKGNRFVEWSHGCQHMIVSLIHDKGGYIHIQLNAADRSQQLQPHGAMLMACRADLQDHSTQLDARPGLPFIGCGMDCPAAGV